MSVAEPTQSPGVTAGKPALWAGRSLSGLVALFLLLDGAAKVLKAAPVLEACARLGIPEKVIPALGVVLIASTLLYAAPRTSILGAILLTGYLGGAVWTHVRADDPAFPIVFPALLGSLLWGGLALREPRLRLLFPIRRSAPA